MKVKIKQWNAVSVWQWDVPNDEVCGICRVPFDGVCPVCKYPGDDCPLSEYDDSRGSTCDVVLTQSLESVLIRFICIAY